MADGGAISHCCEICGLAGLSDEAMRTHTVSCHVEGRAACPFCGLWGVSSAELLLHVNQAHLDYLTPENELMSFIDDQSPSIDEDSDTLSECRGASPSFPDVWPHQAAPRINNINQYASLNGLSSNKRHKDNSEFSLEAYRSNSEGGDQNSSYKPTKNLNQQRQDLHLNDRYKYNSSSNGLDVPHETVNGINGSLDHSDKNKFQQLNEHFNINSHHTTTKTNLNLKSSRNVTTFNNDIGRETNGISKGSKNTNNKSSPSSTNSSLNSYNGATYVEKDFKEYQNGTRNKTGKYEEEKLDYSYTDASGSKITNGCSPGAAGQGSPLRSQLGLKLKSHTQGSSKFQCPLCPHTSDCANRLEEHINRVHFDPTSPSVPPQGTAGLTTAASLQCPLCTRGFETGSDLELHVNIEHRDILSPEKGSIKTEPIPEIDVEPNGGNSEECPMCGISLADLPCQHDVDSHIESHFPKSPLGAQAVPDVEREARKLREQREFEMLRAQYGMDDQGNFREQSAAAMQRAVYAGEMSVADYYERQVGLRAAESHGVDDSSSCTKGVAARVLSLSSVSPGVLRSLLCSAVDHYASSYGDRGWGCGYRNLQMLLSSLLQNTAYNEALYSAWGGAGLPRTAMPSISRLQRMVEAAWAQGFDLQGSEQLGCRLYNTRKWIGATEVVTVLSWLRIRCQLIDFHRPTSPDGGHPELFQWVLSYFEEPNEFKPPLYLQHQGHSRTIIGVEQRRGGSLTLLVLDPSHSNRQVSGLSSTNGAQGALRMLRRGGAAMRARQYQLVAVRGLIDTEEQYEQSKVLRSIRLPQDR